MTILPRKRAHRTALLLIIAVLANSFGSLLLAMAVSRLPPFAHVSLATYVWSLAHNPFLLPGTALTAVYALSQLWLLSWADLSFVVPCIASSYIVSTVLAEFILNENVQLTRWLGVSLICFGVFLVARTPVATKLRSGELPR